VLFFPSFPLFFLTQAPPCFDLAKGGWQNSWALFFFFFFFFSSSVPPQGDKKIWETLWVTMRSPFPFPLSFFDSYLPPPPWSLSLGRRAMASESGLTFFPLFFFFLFLLFFSFRWQERSRDCSLSFFSSLQSSPLRHASGVTIFGWCLSLLFPPRKIYLRVGQCWKLKRHASLFFLSLSLLRDFFFKKRTRRLTDRHFFLFFSFPFLSPCFSLGPSTHTGKAIFFPPSKKLPHSPWPFFPPPGGAVLLSPALILKIFLPPRFTIAMEVKRIVAWSLLLQFFVFFFLASIVPPPLFGYCWRWDLGFFLFFLFDVVNIRTEKENALPLFFSFVENSFYCVQSRQKWDYWLCRTGAIVSSGPFFNGGFCL